MDINKKTLKQFRTEFAETVKDLESKFGLVLSIGNISYNSDQFTTKLTCTAVGDLSEGKSREEAQFKANAPKFGFQPEDYNKEVTIHGETFRFVGFKPNARKNTCVILDVSKDKKYVCRAGAIRSQM